MKNRKIKTFIGFLFFYLFIQPIISDDQKEVEKTINLYFQSWSNQNMNQYESLFSKQALIQFKNNDYGILTEDLPSFIESQKRAHKNSPHPMKEVPLDIQITLKNGVAMVLVSWKLVAGPRTVTGYDYFVLAKTNSKWLIQYLIFQND
jgi:hypothetical protein